jgi:hypothetical protein
MKSKVLFCSLLLTSVIALTPALHADTPPSDMINGKPVKLANHVKAYSGQGNVSVIVVPYQSDDKKRALIMIKGVEGDWDGKVIDHRIDGASFDGHSYVAQYNGKDYVTLLDVPYTGVLELHVPGQKEGIALTPNDGLAQQSDSHSVLREYNRQNGKSQ